jgi:hypothetical protein
MAHRREQKEASLDELAIKALSRSDLSGIEQAYYEALESNSNSMGLHWILIGAVTTPHA